MAVNRTKLRRIEKKLLECRELSLQMLASRGLKGIMETRIRVLHSYISDACDAANAAIIVAEKKAEIRRRIKNKK